MEIIKKHKKAFIIIVIVAALLTGVMAVSMMSFMYVGTGPSKVEIKNESVVIQGEGDYEVIPDSAIQQDEKFMELDFSSGPVKFTKEETYDKNVTGGGDFMTVYLEKGNLIELKYNVKIKKGVININLYDKSGQRFGLGTTSSQSSTEYIEVFESGNYVLQYEVTDFKGNFEIEAIVTRP